CFVFFFSSRRRHTRSKRDWSSDVCSSDLILTGEALDGLGRTPEAIAEFQAAAKAAPREPEVNFGLGYLYWKSHQYDNAKRAFERDRKSVGVGKECRCGVVRCDYLRERM